MVLALSEYFRSFFLGTTESYFFCDSSSPYVFVQAYIDVQTDTYAQASEREGFESSIKAIDKQK